MRAFLILVSVVILGLVTQTQGEPIPPFAGKVTSRAMATHSPRPPYPPELKKNGVGGQGEFIMHIDRKTGTVVSVEVAKSTGVRRLDKSCIETFQKWTFVPGTVTTLHCPVTFVPDSTGSVEKNNALQSKTGNDPAPETSMLDSPRPSYPYEARSRRITGCGRFRIEFKQKNGAPRDVFVVQSTGNPLLDEAAKAAFMRWRTHPNTIEHVIVPVCFDFSSGGPTVHY